MQDLPIPNAPRKKVPKEKKKETNKKQTADGARTAFLHITQFSFMSPFFGMLSLEAVCAP